MIVQVPESGSDARVQVARLPMLPHEPRPEVTEEIVNPAGTVSVTVRPEASDGPLFTTVSV